VIEANKRDFAAIDETGPTWQGEWHHVASIPEALYYKLKAEGKLDDEAYMKKWLNDPDNQILSSPRPGTSMNYIAVCTPARDQVHTNYTYCMVNMVAYHTLNTTDAVSLEDCCRAR
jgi:hypothetical protein